MLASIDMNTGISLLSRYAVAVQYQTTLSEHRTAVCLVLPG